MDAERDDRQPRRVEVAEDLQVRVARPPLQRPPAPVALQPGDALAADRLLEPDDEAGADRFDDRRSAALLAGDRVVEVERAARVDERDRAAARHRRHRVADQLAAHDEHAGRLWAADELVR